MDCAPTRSEKALNGELACNVIKMPCWLAERFYSIEDLRLEPYTTCRIPDSDAREAELVASILEFVASYFNPRLSPIAKLRGEKTACATRRESLTASRGTLSIRSYGSTYVAYELGAIGSLIFFIRLAWIDWVHFSAIN